MKIAFNARLLNSPTLRGWNRYTINLLVELSSLDIELFLYSDSPLHETHLDKLPKNSYQIRISPPMRYLVWEQYWLPQQCKKDRIDILHCPMNFGLPWSTPCPRVLTLHDAIGKVYYSKGKTWQHLNWSSIQNEIYHFIARTRADLIITVSQHSKNDLVEQFHIPENKIKVIYEAADRRFHQPVSEADRLRVSAKYQLDRPYIFYVGGWEKRKNIPFLIQAFAQAHLEGVELVLAGGKDQQRFDLLKLAKSFKVADRLKLLDWVEDVDLPPLYAGALCFVYPSEYEGFGLQLCEAMATGCPVLAANATCLPEVLGDGGETFRLDKSQELEKLMFQVVTNKQFRDNLCNRTRHKKFFFMEKNSRSY